MRILGNNVNFLFSIDVNTRMLGFLRLQMNIPRPTPTILGGFLQQSPECLPAQDHVAVLIGGECGIWLLPTIPGLLGCNLKYIADESCRLNSLQ